jgi:hypothetical protein
MTSTAGSGIRIGLREAVIYCPTFLRRRQAEFHVHDYSAMETDEIAGVDDVQPIGIQRSLQHSHFNWMLGCDIALANVDDRFKKAALIAGRRIQLNVAIVLENLTFGS